MSRDKIKIYFLELVLLIILFFTLFVSNIYKTLYLSIFLVIYTLILKKIIKKRNIFSYMKKEATILMFAFGIIYLIVFYLMGIHFGFYESSVKFGLKGIMYYIIPITLIIYCAEVIREILLATKVKISKVIVIVYGILFDLILFAPLYSSKSLDSILMVIGFIIFASISSNLLYNYLSVRYGKNGIILFRALTILYAYVIPYVPNVYILFRTFLRILYPYFIYLFFENTYSKKTYASKYSENKKNVISTSVMFFLFMIIIMLISCQFKYGILVVGSGSMKGALDMGDATIYERYDNQKLEVGDIIVFEKDKLTIIHRIVDIKKVNGINRYYTKGDANPKMDNDYITKKEIKGISKVRIKYIGYPTIWVRELFN